jgi:DNA N-6-adenine-methyltransferase (Dam)
MRPTRCAKCRRRLVQPATGRPRTTCSHACRQKLYRERHRPPPPPRTDDEWTTPRDLFEALEAEFGFDLDPSATPENALCGRYFTREDDGLSRPWTGRVFVNPPYSDLEPWVAKAWQSTQDGTAELVLLERVCLHGARRGARHSHCRG